MAEAPLTSLWGRHLSAAYKSATSKRGRHSCQEYFSLWAALNTSFAFPNVAHEQNLQNLTNRRGGRAAAGSRPEDRHRESLSPAAPPPSHHGSHLLPACLQLPKNQLTNPSQGAEDSQHSVHIHNSARHAIRPEHLAKSTDIQQEHIQKHNSTALSWAQSCVTLWYTAVTQVLVGQVLCPLCRLPVPDYYA